MNPNQPCLLSASRSSRLKELISARLRTCNMSEIVAGGRGWGLSAQKLESAVPAADPQWQWRTLYGNGVLTFAGLGGDL